MGKPAPYYYYSPPLHCWVLMGDYTVHLDGKVFVIPQGFMWDQASVPRVLWPLASNVELGTIAPLLHDWGYQHGGRMCPDLEYSRSQVDHLFYRSMKEEGVGWRRHPAFWAVRAFGMFAWRAKAKDPLPRATRQARIAGKRGRL